MKTRLQIGSQKTKIHLRYVPLQGVQHRGGEEEKRNRLNRNIRTGSFIFPEGVWGGVEFYGVKNAKPCKECGNPSNM